MSSNSIQEIFEAFNHLKVLIVGDVMLDTYSYGEVTRMSPEAPVPVVQVNKLDKKPGGAANVALNVAALGATPFLCSVIGDDAKGNELAALLESHSISSNHLIRSNKRITTEKHRVVSGGHQMIRLDHEHTNSLVDENSEKLLEHFEQLIPEVDLVIVEDYDKGVLDKAIIDRITTLCNQHSKPLAVDPKFKNWAHYKNVSLFKPNLREFMQAIQIPDQEDETISEAVRLFRNAQKHQMVLLTLGSKGMYIHSEFHSGFTRGKSRDVSDVSGAGDTVISIAGLCLTLELKPEIIAELANLGGGIVCEYQGVIPVNKNQLEQEALQSQRLVDLL